MRYPLISREEEERFARRARLGDIITEINGRKSNSPRTLMSQAKNSGPGSRLELKVRRGNQDVNITLQIPSSFSPKEEKEFILGIKVGKVADLSAPQIKMLGSKRGLLVTEVASDSPAALADLMDYNREARDKLILHNLRWVVTISKQYQKRGLQLAELINEGNLGLIQAVTKFDERRKTRLTTYSNWWIRYYIVSALASRHLIKLPIKMRHLARKIRDSYGVLSQHLGRAPSIEELARELEVTPEEVSAAFDCGVAELSIDALPFEDSKVTFEEVLRDTRSRSPAEHSAREQREREVRLSLDETLADRELYVVSRHFGVPLPPDRKFTVKKLTAVFGKPADEIQQTICSACRKLLSRLRRSLGSDGLKRYAKLTPTDMKALPEVLKKGTQHPRTTICKIMGRVRKNIPSAVTDNLETLNLEEREVFCLFWNVNQQQELNLRELGDLLGVSREAARQVKERAIKKLKKNLRPRVLEDFFREAV
jgi:RNA polymerase sigma factor (sigma-70 family)